ncbi:MAG: hypothetical protein AB7O57_02865 [Hyphomicrobiaceae bacterium]
MTYSIKQSRFDGYFYITFETDTTRGVSRPFPTKEAAQLVVLDLPK